MKKKKQYKILSIIIAIIFCFFFGTVAYSAMYSTMEISGIAYVRPIKDVRVTDFRINSLENGASVSYTEFSKDTVSFNINLQNSLSSAVFDIEVTNYGNVDVGIAGFVEQSGADLILNIKNYNVGKKLCDENGKCNNMAVVTFQLIVGGIPDDYNINIDLLFKEFRKVTYTGITNYDYPTEVIDGGDLSVQFKEDLKRISVLSNGIEIGYYPTISSGQTINVNDISGDIEFKEKEQIAKLVNGEIDEVGSEVCIKNECFNIISKDNNTVKMLSKYNLYVGGEYNNATWTAYGDEATGIQSSSMLGYVSNSESAKGTTTTGSVYSCSEIDENIERYMNNYLNILESYSIDILSIDMMSQSNFLDIGNCTDKCDIPPSTAHSEPCGASGYEYICEEPTWLTNTSFWLKEVYMGCQHSGLKRSYDKGKNELSYNNYDDNSGYGVRPVIEISVDDIYIPPIGTIVSGDLDTVGSEVAIGDEHFYVISSTNETVTMLSKYNLYVGGSYDGTTYTSYGEEATGKQDVSMYGYNPTTSISTGALEFASSSYWANITSYPTDVFNSNSKLYSHVMNYKSYLKSLGATIQDSRLITFEELKKLGCDIDNKTCLNSDYSFLYSTSYWSGTAFDEKYIYRVRIDGIYSNTGYESSNNWGYGVRPVITIPKSEISGY